MNWLKKLHGWCNEHEWTIFLIILVLVLRMPSLIMPHHYGDEEIYFVMGRAWANGVPLYQAMFDHKPPLIYIMAGIAPTMLAFRGLLAAVMVLHTILFVKLTRLFFGKTRPALVYVSSLIFVALSTLPTLEGLTVNAELLMMVPVTWAILILWNARPAEGIRPYIMAGLLGGIGWLFKIPVVFDMMAVGLFFFVFKKASLKEGIRAILSWPFVVYALAFVAPLAMTFVYYYLKGTGPDYLATVLTVNLGYVSSWSTSTYTFNPFKSGLVVRGMILALFTTLLYIVRKKLDKPFVLACLWAGFALFGGLLSARPYPHYLQEVVPAVSLLIPYIFVIEHVLGWVVIGVMILLGGLTQWQIKFWGYPTVEIYRNYWQYVTKKISWTEYSSRFDNTGRNYAIAQYLNERLLEDEEIYVWGTDPTIYNLTNRLPTGGKYIVSFHVHDLKKYDYVAENLEKNQPKFIVVLPNSGEFSALTTMIDSRYILAETIDGAQIYIAMK